MSDQAVFGGTDHPWRRRPAEHCPGVGWIQGGRRLRGVKPKYHFVWPKDGKNGSTWGRWKDILHGQGPDIHVTISADKMDYMYNRQRRPRWSEHTNLDDRLPDGSIKHQPFWIGNKRHGGISYDFFTRRYRPTDGDTWADALWQEEPNDQFTYPYAFKDIQGQWYQRGQFGEAFGFPGAFGF